MKIRLVNNKDGYTQYRNYRGCGYLNGTCSVGRKPAREIAFWIILLGRYLRFEITWIK